MAAASSTPFFGMMREEEQMKLQIQTSSNPSSSSAQTAAPVKKKRNLPGTPNPDAEVIALSPKTLMATNRFICEVCNKGFQREQNLQLHRRGHNLPWKLRQKSTKEVRRRVYLCPEPTCVHHDPSRALGDLTGVKKHFSRKHGEKKWKCDKCSKKYAVQSDWKAHSKTCGTREYRCDCGTLFSRRDSFITHRAFCDALAQESARLPTSLTTFSNHIYGGSNNNNNMSLSLSQVNTQLSALQDQTHQSSDLLRLGGAGPWPTQFDHLFSQFDLQQTKPFHHGLMPLHELQNNTNTSFNLSFFSNGNSTNNMINGGNSVGGNQNAHLLIPEQFGNSDSSNNEPATLFAGNMMNDHQLGTGVSSLLKSLPMHQNSQVLSDESVLPQMSATALLQKAVQMGATASGNGSASSSLLRGFPTSSTRSTNFINENNCNLRSQMENETHLQDLMASLANGSPSIFQHSFPDGLTRDFLGVGVGSMHHGNISDHNMGSLDSEMKSASTSARSFGSGSMQ